MKKMHPSVWKRTLTKLLNEDNTAKRQTVTESQNEHLTQKRAANCFAHMYQEESTVKLPRERTRHVKNEIKKAALRKHTCWRMHDWCHPEGWTQSPKPAHSVELKQITSLNTPRPKRQPSMETYINMTPSNPNVKDTPVQPKRGNPPERYPPTPVKVLQEKTSNKCKSQKEITLTHVYWLIVFDISYVLWTQI